MGLSEKQMEHPRMAEIMHRCRQHVDELCRSFDISVDDILAIEAHSNRIHDDLAAFILRAHKVNHD